MGRREVTVGIGEEKHLEAAYWRRESVEVICSLQIPMVLEVAGHEVIFSDLVRALAFQEVQAPVGLLDLLVGRHICLLANFD